MNAWKHKCLHLLGTNWMEILHFLEEFFFFKYITLHLRMNKYTVYLEISCETISQLLLIFMSFSIFVGKSVELFPTLYNYYSSI